MSEVLQRIQTKLCYTFQDLSLLELALTHSSFVNENNLIEHNERLEFLGDAVLELQISQTLYHKYPAEREGTLTNLRSRMVNEKSLAKIAKAFSLGEALYMGKGEENQGGRNRPALLADALEAILGAVFLDGGYKTSQDVIMKIFEHSWPEPTACIQNKSYKTLLQEYTQAKFHFTPEYKLVAEHGPEHAKTFTVSYNAPDNYMATGIANSLKRAEHEAARIALEYYQSQQQQ